jgi:antitoxin HigA-1
MSRRLRKVAPQRYPPHHPHKPSSQARGARPPGTRLADGSFIKLTLYQPQPDGSIQGQEAHLPRPFAPSWSVHPGEILAEELEERGWDEARACAELGWKPSVLEWVLAGSHDIDEQLAADLSRALGSSTMYWLNLQAHYDEWQGRQTSPGQR